MSMDGNIEHLHLNEGDVIISNKESLDGKISRFIDDGSNHLVIFTDFDFTLTDHHKREKDCTDSTFASLMTEGVMPEEFVRKQKTLFAEYHPIEIDPNISKARKEHLMREWWQKQLALMVEYKLNRDTIEDIARNKTLLLRDGTEALLRILHEQGVPIVIISAGLGDIIRSTLAENGVAMSNVHIIANFFSYDSEGNVTGYTNDTIHSLNKTGRLAQDLPEWNTIKKNRRNVILLGDNIDDARAASKSGLRNQEVIKIGFLDDPTDKARLEAYKKAFDIVIVGRGADMRYPQELVDRIARGAGFGDP